MTALQAAAGRPERILAIENAALDAHKDSAPRSAVILAGAGA